VYIKILSATVIVILLVSLVTPTFAAKKVYEQSINDHQSYISGTICGVVLVDSRAIGKITFWDNNRFTSHIVIHQKFIDLNTSELVGTLSVTAVFEANKDDQLPQSSQVNGVVTCTKEGTVDNVHVGITIQKDGSLTIREVIKN